MTPATVHIVSRLVRAIVDREVVSRYRRLRAADITRTAAGDVSTTADLTTEAELARALQRLDRGCFVLGEESQKRTGPLGSQDHRRLWVLDPLDGTENFISGSPRFAT